MSEQLIETGVFHLSPADYHSDRRTKRPTLSRSMAEILVTKTPRHLLAASPRLREEFPDVEVVPVVPKETDAFDIGRAAHAILLGRGGDIDVVNAKSWTPNASKQRDASRAAGRTAILLKQYNSALDMAKVARRKLEEAKVSLDPSRSEMAAYAEIEGVTCRAMVDNAPAWPGAALLDLKTCEDASEEACLRSVESYEYDVQDRWYREVWKAATGESRRMLFLFCREIASARVPADRPLRGPRRRRLEPGRGGEMLRGPADLPQLARDRRMAGLSREQDRHLARARLPPRQVGEPPDDLGAVRRRASRGPRGAGAEMTWQPPEARVDDLLERFTARQLAVGYLRAQRRFRETELTLKTLMSLAEAESARRHGDDDRASDLLDEATRRLKSNTIVNGDG